MKHGQARIARPGLLVARHPFLGILIVGLGTLGVPFDSAVNVAFPAIVRGFGLPIPAIQWVVIAYTLTYAALMLVFGRIGDMLGYRRIFLFGCGWSAVAFLACAAAPTYPWLLLARVLQGIGAAMALSCGPALATSFYPESERTRILGWYTMVFGLGAACGPVLAGQLVGHWDWPSVFWFRAPIALAAFLLTWILPPGERHGQAQFDSVGAVLLVVAITGLLLALNQLQHVNGAPWPALVLGCLTLAAGQGFVWQERRTAQPIINLQFFHDRDFALVNAAHVALNIAGFSIMLLVPFYLDRVVGVSAPVAGVMLSSAPVGLMVAGPVAGRVAAWIAPQQLALVGAALLGLAQLLIGGAGPQPLILPLLLAMAMHGFGLGLFQVAYFDIATATIPRRDRGVAGSLVMMTRTVGVVTGATVLILLFQSLRGPSGAAGALADVTAFMRGFRGAFWIAAVLPALTLVAGLLCGWARPKRRP